MKLPERFLENMKELLGEELEEYLCCMQQESYSALRVNTERLIPEQFRKISPFALKEIPWTAKGFYYDAAKGNPSRHPYYFAGLYYIQEPSAMIPASILPIEEGDSVLDLCAAPGGKSTELAAKLRGTGLLVANDISVSRAMALAKNLQVAGVRNAVVTAETPERLAGHLGQYFDKILIDAPCSGEGMFRRDPGMIKDWQEKGPEYYVQVQRQILHEAWKMLKPGGQMVYSTCTFSPLEDEGMVQWFLEQHPDMHICPVERKEGYCPGMPEVVKNGSETLRECVRIFPHRVNGEGHFAVLLQKDEDGESIRAKATPVSMAFSKKEEQARLPQDASAFLQEVQGLSGKFVLHKDTLSLVTEQMQAFVGLRTIFRGLILGSMKKGRFEPGPQLALALGKEDYPRVVDLPAQDMAVIKYLKGETLTSQAMYKGYALVCVDGFALGWCKGNGQGTLKNKYYPGWRMQ